MRADIQACALRKLQQGVLTEEEYNVVCEQAERNLNPQGYVVRRRRSPQPAALCEWSAAEEEEWVVAHRIPQVGDCYLRISSAKIVALRCLVRRPDAASVDLRDPLRWQADFPKASGAELPPTAAAARTPGTTWCAASDWSAASSA